jgi:hypothetical protein
VDGGKNGKGRFSGLRPKTGDSESKIGRQEFGENKKVSWQKTASSRFEFPFVRK